jgi:replicative DNA helicase
MSYPDLISEIKICKEAFSNGIYGNIYEIMKGLPEIDMITVKSECDKRGVNIDMSDLARMQSEVISRSHAAAYADIINDSYIRRETANNARKLINKVDGEEDCSDAVKDFVDVFDELLSNSKEFNLNDSEKDSKDYIEYYNERHKRLKSGDKLGFNTGYKNINIDNGQACLLSALPKQGKSMLAANIAMNVSVDSKVIFFSFEMTKYEIHHRLLSIHTGRDINDFRDCKLSLEELEAMETSFHNKYKNLKIIDKAMTIEEVEEICKIEKIKNGLDFIVLDYLQRTPTKKSMELVQKTIHNSSKFKSIILNLGIGGIALSQFSRESAKKDFPSSNDLFGGEAMKQDFDNLVILHNGSLNCEEEYQPYDPIYIIRKTHDRNGGQLGDFMLRRNKNKAGFADAPMTIPGWAK